MELSYRRIFQQSLLFALVSLILLTPVFAEARTVVRSGDTVSIGQDQLIEGDLYTAANIINVSGEIKEDLLVAGAEVTINGRVGKDVLIFGGEVDVQGTVGDDLRILGGDIVIAQPVLGDVFVVGGDVEVLPTATITGDLTVVGGSIEVAGSVDGRVFGWVESLRIDNVVGGDVEVTTVSLTLGDKADVAGDIKYTSQNQLVRSQSANVAGEVLRTDPVVEERSSDLMSLLMPLLIILFSVALWYLLSRRVLGRVVERALEPGIKRVLIGTFVLLFGPLAVSIMMVSMLGMLAGIILLTTYILMITLAVIALPAVMAQFVYSIIDTNHRPVNLLTLLAGTLLVGICAVVPFIGPVLLVGFFVLTFGALIDLLVRANR